MFSAFTDKPVALFTRQYLTMLLRKTLSEFELISSSIVTNYFNEGVPIVCRVLVTRLVASTNNRRHSQQSLQ